MLYYYQDKLQSLFRVLQATENQSVRRATKFRIQAVIREAEDRGHTLAEITESISVDDVAA